MKKASSNKRCALPWLVAGLLGLFTSTADAAALRVTVHRGGQFLACIPLPQPRFELSFIHSVSLTPVTDVYQLTTADNDGWTLLQTRERFIAHGQGLPSMANEPDATAFRHHDGVFELEMARPIPRLIVRTDARFRNRLHTGQQTVDLNQWPDNGLLIAPVSRCD
ncbi:DUF1850 domain-containing protein [Marinobacter xestospongiae]|uniref:DUF1850 domain-containing protein n=1 Tax=Marinobacter xestospongiae TaxID=994319 RepID=UPI0020065E4B|nr:DUF1850 domain-containing protein [Marinobacter xestospongiae]